MNFRTKKIRRWIAFILMILGIFSGILNKLISAKFCVSCIPYNEFLMFLIFLFVEIIFVVCGAALLISENYALEISFS